jgi:hypothetical protein
MFMIMLFYVGFSMAYDAERDWTVINSYSIPEGASGLA